MRNLTAPGVIGSLDLGQVENHGWSLCFGAGERGEVGRLDEVGEVVGAREQVEEAAPV